MVDAGYKLRKHIAKALQARSAAIRTALDRYNTAARAINPPRRELHWDEVVEYAFLSEFDLLRDSRQDVSRRPWATPAARLTMDWYFKKCRAVEEIQCLNIEIRRLLTHIQDEDRHLRRCEEYMKPINVLLAHQIATRRNNRSRFNALHLQRLHHISQLPRFTGTLLPGQTVLTAPGDSINATPPTVPARLAIASSPLPSPAGAQAMDTADELEEEEYAEENVEQASCVLQDVVHATVDLEHSDQGVGGFID